MHSARPETRRRVILELLSRKTVRSQAELGSLLANQGLSVNQATLSRDLRDLGVVKGPGGYRAATDANSPSDRDGSALGPLERARSEWLLRAASAENQLVLHTPPGGAQPLGIALDYAELPGILGTIAGDDTVLVICKDSRTATHLAEALTSDALL